MPELPEVETVRVGLSKNTIGRSIAATEVILERMVAAPNNPAEFAKALQGAIFQGWQRRGKYLLAKLSDHKGSDRGWLGVHLRMTGQMLMVDRHEPIHSHTRIRLFLDRLNGQAKSPRLRDSGAGSDPRSPQINKSLDSLEQELRFADQRTFGRMWWVPPGVEPEQVITGLQLLGVEPLLADYSRNPKLSAAYLTKRLSKSNRAIKTALLDQAIVAGIGNIYADETLFLSKIHPEQKALSLTKAQIKRLPDAIAKSLQAGIAHGGTTFSNFQDVAGDKGNYIYSAWVFRRQGQPCRVCNTTIERIKVGGRSTHFCPKCQSSP
ncbi:DNA-(apurinic or apyrimidinic site) lyase, Formamidopyrimidine-DNA glycosylase [Thalassoporum mexicanum PCC 7367]|uniref:bifunctional DNA-formamidopyrimidine glycosylase/DNA-(apurinic or apyrimidinic site) lyase n=1 Tax=Thalassoporum mexicanum TaxID=3457544 RepID=UPI00029FAFED|nr:bifunctional DNA-formamidopyrimidine glycosylase/DNA-(apurinic or apyrimidinic site) lyase [Pseudanabaena sp. PCC 7367]AFY71013.1 DNA-(apurinic or apyrimidinic site) lyase, Formamidopyrimidine-DNA glycosylase [Pseudanabaena sp. PCC 7367]